VRQFRTFLGTRKLWGGTVNERAGANVWRVIAPILGCGVPYLISRG
jgi:hypothetical protein